MNCPSRFWYREIISLILVLLCLAHVMEGSMSCYSFSFAAVYKHLLALKPGSMLVLLHKMCQCVRNSVACSAQVQEYLSGQVCPPSPLPNVSPDCTN